MNKEDQVNFKLNIEPNKDISLSLYQLSNDSQSVCLNDFLFLSNQQHMLSAKELDEIADKVNAPKLPDMFYGFNRFYIVLPIKDLVYEINPVQMIEYATYKIRDKIFNDPNENFTKEVNCVYYHPSEYKFQFYDKWKNLKIPDTTEIQTKESTADWFYSSSYMGCIYQLSEHPIFKQNENLLFDSKQEYKFYIKRELTNESIPVDKLMPTNPVLKYWEIPIFDDELNDNGLTMGSFRFRVMKDCFFGLLRQYLRLDNVVVRVIDTRIFHAFGSNYILRNFQVRENTTEELKKKGFIFNSEWLLNHNQSDIIYGYLDTKLEVKDKLIFG